MPRSLADLSFWPRLLATSGAIFLASTGLCGANTLAYQFFTRKASTSPMPGVLFATGFLELLGMIIGLGGVLIALVGWPLSSLLRRARSTSETE